MVTVPIFCVPFNLTCWRRLRDWQRRGVWKELLCALLQKVEFRHGIGR